MASETPRFFNLLGIVSTLSLSMIAFFVLPGAVRGDFSSVSRFLGANRGIEPFLIFFFPVILIASLAWLWRLYKGRPEPS